MPATIPRSSRSVLPKLDGRTREGRLIRDTRADLVAHVGGKPSATQRALIERVVQLTLRIARMDERFVLAGEQTVRETSAYLAWSTCLSRALRDLGVRSAAPRVEAAPAHRAAA